MLTTIIGLAATFFWNKFADIKTVPDIRGKTELEATGTLIAAGFKNLGREQIPGGVEGFIGAQLPLPGSHAKADTPIMLYIQAGSPPTLSRFATQQANMRTMVLPAGTPIYVRMTSDLLVKREAAPPSFDAELDAPVTANNGVIAMKGSRVSLEVSSSVDSVQTIVRLAVRECRQIDDRSLYLSTSPKEFRSPITWGTLFAIMIICTLVGAVFSGVLTLGMDLGISGGTLGFLVGLVIAVFVVATQNKVDIPTGTRLEFVLRDSVQIDMATNAIQH